MFASFLENLKSRVNAKMETWGESQVSWTREAGGYAIWHWQPLGILPSCNFNQAAKAVKFWVTRLSDTLISTSRFVISFNSLWLTMFISITHSKVSFSLYLVLCRKTLPVWDLSQNQERRKGEARLFCYYWSMLLLLTTACKLSWQCRQTQHSTLSSFPLYKRTSTHILILNIFKHDFSWVNLKCLNKKNLDKCLHFIKDYLCYHCGRTIFSWN
jgi:hypothetical protein